MFTRRNMLVGAMLAVLAAAAVAGVAWYTLVRGDAPSSVNLAGAVASVQSTPAAGQAAPAPTGDAQGPAGRWTLAPNGDSFVGYRVKEELARIGATTAVGRTKSITASLEFNGSAITDVRVTADLTTLQSDQALRDRALATQALETRRYPTATFVLTQPIALDQVPEEGVPLRTTAVGDLTLHGVTRAVAIDLEGQRTNGLVVVVGSTDIRFADFGIAQPRAAAVLSVEDHALIELQLVFQQDAQGRDGPCLGLAGRADLTIRLQRSRGRIER